MFIDLFSETLLGNEDEPIFRGYVLPDQPEFLVLFCKLLQLRFTTNIFHCKPEPACDYRYIADYDNLLQLYENQA